MFGKHAYLSFLRIVGTRAFVHVEGYTTNLHPKAWEGVIVGYYSDKPTFRMSDRYTGRISSSRDVSFIEEPLTVLPTADSATSQARARQLALQRQEYPNSSSVPFRSTPGLSERTKQTVRYLFRYPTPTRNLWPYHKRKSANSQRPLLEDQRLQPGELLLSFKHLEVATTAPARKTALDHRHCLVNYLSQSP